MRRLITVALLLCGFTPGMTSAVEWNGYARRIGFGHSAGYHVYDACPELHTRHTGLAHQVNGWYYGGHPKYQLNSPNAGFYSTQWCQIAPFGPSYGGLQNYTSSAPYRGVYPLNGCAYEDVPVWSDIESVGDESAPHDAETVEPAASEPAPAPPAEVKPSEPAAKPSARRPASSRVRQTSQPIVRPVR